jgi:hypothetical protein
VVPPATPAVMVAAASPASLVPVPPAIAVPAAAIGLARSPFPAASPITASFASGVASLSSAAAALPRKGDGRSTDKQQSGKRGHGNALQHQYLSPAGPSPYVTGSLRSFRRKR